MVVSSMGKQDDGLPRFGNEQRFCKLLLKNGFESPEEKTCPVGRGNASSPAGAIPWTARPSSFDSRLFDSLDGAASLADCNGSKLGAGEQREAGG
jgi:hypothetical protein